MSKAPSWDKENKQWKFGYINSNGKRTSVRATSSFDATTREGGLEAIQELRDKVKNLGLVQTTVLGKSCLKQLDSTHHNQPPQHAQSFQSQYTPPQPRAKQILEQKTVLPNGRHPLPDRPTIYKIKEPEV